MRWQQIITDFTGLCGAALAAYGCWLIYPPSGFIVGGALLIAAACLLSRQPGG